MLVESVARERYEIDLREKAQAQVCFQRKYGIHSEKQRYIKVL